MAPHPLRRGGGQFEGIGCLFGNESLTSIIRLARGTFPLKKNIKPLQIPPFAWPLGLPRSPDQTHIIADFLKKIKICLSFREIFQKFHGKYEKFHEPLTKLSLLAGTMELGHLTAGKSKGQKQRVFSSVWRLKVNEEVVAGIHLSQREVKKKIASFGARLTCFCSPLTDRNHRKKTTFKQREGRKNERKKASLK